MFIFNNIFEINITDGLAFCKNPNLMDFSKKEQKANEPERIEKNNES